MLEDLFSLVFFDGLISVFSMLGTSNNVVIVPWHMHFIIKKVSPYHFSKSLWALYIFPNNEQIFLPTTLPAKVGIDNFDKSGK